MRKTLLMCFFLLGAFCMKSFPLDIEFSGSPGLYWKDNEFFKQIYSKNSKTFGVGAVFDFFSRSGFYLDANYMSSNGESTYYKSSLSYNELQLSCGLKIEFKLFNFKDKQGIKRENYGLNFFAKGGGLYIHYSEKFEEEISGDVFGVTAGGGVILWLHRFGIGFEVMKNFADKYVAIQGLDSTEKINFGGLRINIKFSFKLPMRL